MYSRFFGLLAIAVPILFSGCSQATNEAPDSAAVSVASTAFNVTNAPTIEFNVPDMMCPEGCGEATREILAGQEGVKDVKIDFPAKIAIVAVNEKAFDAEKALAELVDHGFDNTTLKASSAQ